MKRNTRYPLPMALFWIILGATLFLCGCFEVLDSYWSGMGGGFLGVGILQLIRALRYKSDPEYKTKTDRANNDERNKFLAAQAWSWTGYLLVMIAAVGSILFKLAGRDDLMEFSAFAVCLILVLYWLCFLFLSRKY